jgi:hypothetical protein
MWSGLALCVIIILCILSTWLDSTIFLGDSHIIMVRSREMAEGAFLFSRSMREFYIRGVTEFAAFAPAIFFGKWYFVAIGPSFALSGVLSLGWFVWRAAQLESIRPLFQWVLPVLAASILATTYVFLQYSLAIHTAVPNAFYTLAMVACAWFFCRTGESRYTILSTIFGTGAVLCRVESKVFVIMWLSLFAFGLPLSRGQRIYLVLGPMMAVILWSLINTAFILSTGASNIDSSNLNNLIPLLLASVVLALSAHPDWPILLKGTRVFPVIALLGSAALFVSCTINFPQYMIDGAYAVYRILAETTWGGGTLVLLLGFAGTLFDKDRLDSIITFGAMITLFVVLAIPVSFQQIGYTWEPQTWDSSNRILLQLLPILTFYLAIKLTKLHALALIETKTEVTQRLPGTALTLGVLGLALLGLILFAYLK